MVSCGFLGGGFSDAKTMPLFEIYLEWLVCCCVLRIRNVLFRLRILMFGWVVAVFGVFQPAGLVVAGLGLMG